MATDAVIQEQAAVAARAAADVLADAIRRQARMFLILHPI